MTILTISKAHVPLWLFVATSVLPFTLWNLALKAGEILMLFDK